MFLLPKVIPLDSRDALGFRGKLGLRSCFFCGITEENNFDENGKLQLIKVQSVDKNIHNTRASNHLYVCANPKCKQNR